MMRNNKRWLLNALGALAVAATATPALAQSYGESEKAQNLDRMDMVVRFEPGTAVMSPESRAKLDEAALWLRENPDRQLVLIGHTAREGPAFRQRAMAARDYLMSKGIEANRIAVVSVKEVSSIADLRTPNRRIVYLVEAETQPPAWTAPAAQQPLPGTRRYLEEEERARPPSGIGIGVTVGGGVGNFVDRAARRFTGVAGTWEARLIYGTQSPIGAELSYVGSAQDVSALGLDSSANLISNGGEGTLRLNGGPMFSDVIQPYLFGGVGFTHYKIVNSDFNTSNIKNSDTVGYIPAGAGLSFNLFNVSGLLLDVRGTIRPTFNNTLIRDEEGRKTDLTSWSATARLGWQF